MKQVRKLFFSVALMGMLAFGIGTIGVDFPGVGTNGYQLTE